MINCFGLKEEEEDIVKTVVGLACKAPVTVWRNWCASFILTTHDILLHMSACKLLIGQKHLTRVSSDHEEDSIIQHW